MTVLKLQHTPGTRNKSTDTGNGPRELDTSWDNRASKISPEGGGEGLAAPSLPHLDQEVPRYLGATGVSGSPESGSQLPDKHAPDTAEPSGRAQLATHEPPQPGGLSRRTAQLT